MKCSAKTCTFSSQALPIGVSTADYKIGIYNAENVLQGTTTDGNYVISSTATTPTTRYSKIANDGSVLADDAKLGPGSKDWACTKDNQTGLIWEVKKTYGLHDSAETYTWNDDLKLVDDVNVQTWCGADDWRLPTNEELKGLVLCSDGKTKTLGKEEAGYICTGSPTAPTIDTTYFPNTVSDWFWSSSPNAGGSSSAWLVSFNNGGSSSSDNKRKYYGVRLVR